MGDLIIILLIVILIIFILIKENKSECINCPWKNKCKRK